MCSAEPYRYLAGHIGQNYFIPIFPSSYLFEIPRRRKPKWPKRRERGKAIFHGLSSKFFLNVDGWFRRSISFIIQARESQFLTDSKNVFEHLYHEVKRLLLGHDHLFISACFTCDFVLPILPLSPLLLLSLR